MRLKIITILSVIFISTFVLDAKEKIKLMRDNYYIVIVNTLNLRTEPSINAPVKDVLNIGKIVKKLKSQGETIAISNVQGRWFFVDTESRDNSNPDSTLSGWVFSGYLSDGHEFERVNGFRRTLIQGTIGDSNITIEINADGSVKTTTKGYYEKEPLKFEGQLFVFKNIFIEYKSKYKSSEVLIKKDDGRICTMYGLCSEK